MVALEFSCFFGSLMLHMEYGSNIEVATRVGPSWLGALRIGCGRI